MNNIFFPVDAITEARLLLIKVFPALGLAPEIIRILFFDSIIAKCKLVLRPRIASIAKSAGLSVANNTLDSLFFLFVFFISHWDTGILA